MLPVVPFVEPVVVCAATGNAQATPKAAQARPGQKPISMLASKLDLLPDRRKWMATPPSGVSPVAISTMIF